MRNKRNLYIVGAGDFARETESWLEDVPARARDWELVGFLYAGDAALPNYPSTLDVVGNWEDFGFTDSDLVVLGFTDVQWKKRVYEHLADKVEFLTFVHPSVKLGKFARLGKGCVIFPNCIVSTNAEIGECVSINSGSQIGHDVKIGAFSSLMPHVDLGGHVRVGENVLIGAKATVIPGRRIVDDVTVGAGSLAVRHIKEPCTVIGNPARKLM